MNKLEALEYTGLIGVSSYSEIAPMQLLGKLGTTDPLTYNEAQGSIQVRVEQVQVTLPIEDIICGPWVVVFLKENMTWKSLEDKFPSISSWKDILFPIYHFRYQFGIRSTFHAINFVDGPELDMFLIGMCEFINEVRVCES